jgi:hypothetical protein
MLAVLAWLVLGAPAALAQQEEDHSAHHPAAGDEAPAKGSDEAPAQGDEQAAGGHDHGAAAKPSPAGENMAKVEGLMQQIGQTADPAQKRELLRAHLQALREQMKLVRSENAGAKMAMMGGGKKDGGGGMMGGDKKGGMMGGGMMGMHKKVEQRLEMLERVLQQLIERENVEAELDGR